VSAGLSQALVAKSAGIGRSTLSLIERNQAPDVTFLDAGAVAAILGLDLSVRLFPAGPAIRDVGQIRLMARFRELVSSAFTWAYERGMAVSGDQRGFDALLRIGALRLGIDAETRLYDVQALLRRTELKKRDSLADRIVLVLADTRHNREAVALAKAEFAAAFPCPRATLVAALREGRDPGSDGYLLV
jgi:transcriptional regulator with XRE-family HTH domain